MSLHALPPLLTCRRCTYSYRATVCPICKTPSPQFIAVKALARRSA
jgi:rubrerythrin